VAQAIDSIFVLASLAAAWSDARTRRIPNGLTFGLIAFGVGAHGITGGWLAGLESLGLATIVIVVGSFVHSRHWLSGGDIKLIAAGGAVFGYPSVVLFLLLTGLAGGVLSAVVATRQRRLVGTLNQIVHFVLVPGMPLEASTEHGTLPYGLAIAAGASLTTLSLCFRGLRLPL
jgi:prepilin peptidase CpaA